MANALSYAIIGAGIVGLALSSDPAHNGGRRVMCVAGNDADANTAVAALVAALGFAPVTLGKIAEGGSLLRFRGPLVLQNLLQY